MIKINSLSFGYQSSSLLFDCIDLELSKGKIHGILGMNGEGKTSLLKLIIGLIRPNDGHISVNDQEPHKRHPGFLSQIYLLPEENFIPAYTAKQTEKLFAPFYHDFDSDMFRHLLSEFDVGYQQDIDNLSSGQRKKLAISFAFACNTSILLMDEPTNGLDISSKAIFRRLLASVFNEGKTVIISTHQVHDIKSIIDSLVILHHNKIAFAGDIDEIASKYSFVRTTVNSKDSYIFTEKSILGNNNILPNLGDQPGDVNIETFFNAIVEGQLN
jgi:ABC-2 type transport system ATP-binding protein